MSTINISMPEAMRHFVEAQAASGHYSASEYVRHLIRQEQQRKTAIEQQALHALLAISAKQLDEGLFVQSSAEEILRKGREKRRKANA